MDRAWQPAKGSTPLVPLATDPAPLAAADGAVIAVVALVVATWLATASGHFSFGALGALAAALATWWIAGTILAGTPTLRGLIPWTLPATLLLGFAAVNTALFVLAWASPLPIGGNFFVIALVTAAAAWVRGTPVVRGDRSHLPVAVAVLVALACATLWTRDTLQPLEPRGATTLVKPWLDAYFHASQIRIFADARGAASIEDFSMAGAPARLYHYASYLTPALIRNAGGVSGFEAFAGLHVPLGLFLVGLGAATLVGGWWGAWAGVGAAAAFLLPDTFQQVGGNGFFGYHWMQQVGPAGGYGVALLALAWSLVGAACRQARAASLLVAWIVGGLVIAYKAQFFVAGALLLWTIPPLLYAGLRRRTRIAWLAGALGLYGAGVLLSRHVPALPGMWLDGSSTEGFLELVHQWSDGGAIAGFFGSRFGLSHSWAENVLWGGIYLIVVTLGPWTVVWSALAVVLRRDLDRFTLALPILVAANFVVMALGLAMDDSGIGNREELLHRPFVWVYFITVAWSGGAITRLLLRPGRSERGRRLAGMVVLPILLLAPLATNRRVQELHTVGLSYLEVQTGFIEVSRWLRANAAPGAVVQDLSFDPASLQAGLSDLRPYVNEHLLPRPRLPDEAHRRMANVIALRDARDSATLRSMIKVTGIDWFVVQDGDSISWPTELLDKPAFASGGVRVYRLH